MMSFTRESMLSAGLIVLCWFSLWLVRFSGPCDLLDNSQDRQVSYVLDSICNDRWVCQVDWGPEAWRAQVAARARQAPAAVDKPVPEAAALKEGELCAKPPLYTWLAAAFVYPFGRVTEFNLYFPNALVMLGLCLTVWYAGRRYFGNIAGLLAAVSLLACGAGLRMIQLVRTDALFTWIVAIAAFLAFAAWQRGKGWTWFWLAAAAATLTKGPLGLLLAGLGLLAVLWERRRDPEARLSGSHWLGIAIFLVLTGGWFYLAWRAFGQALIDKMIFRELLQHALESGAEKMSRWQSVIYPSTKLFARYLPWILITLIGIWRVFRQPAAAPEERRFERFLVCWLLAGLAMFSLASHQRADLIFPLLPPAALLAAREGARWLKPVSRPRLLQALALVWAVLLVSCFVHYRSGSVVNKSGIRQSQGVKKLAAAFARQYGRLQPLFYTTDAPFGLQIFLSTKRPHLTPAAAAARLDKAAPALVAVQDLDRLKGLLAPGTECYEVLRYPARGQAYVVIVSNQRPVKKE